jgi:hypothetical protein
MNRAKKKKFAVQNAEHLQWSTYLDFYAPVVKIQFSMNPEIKKLFAVLIVVLKQ